MTTQLDLFGDHVDTQAKDPIWILKNRPAPDPNSPIIVSYGGGTNSTAMLIAMVLKGIKPDLILFADTGGELPETYDWVNTFSDWLKSNSFPEVTKVRKQKTEPTRARKSIIVNWKMSYKSLEWFLLSIYLGLLSNGSQYFEYSSLYEKCLTLKTLPSRTFNRGECSITWKIEPQNLYVGNHYTDIIGETKIRKFIGYHYNEVSRLLNSKKNPYDDDIYRYEYPLIDWEITQENCIALIKTINLGVPPKSSCFFCPNRKIKEVQDLKQNHPELYDAACFMEENFNKKENQFVGLGRHWRWSDIDDLTTLEQLIIDNKQASRKCACID
jgi:hypothetical protein